MAIIYLNKQGVEMENQDTVIGQQDYCNHLVGLSVCSFPQYGEADSSIYADSRIRFEGEEFEFCPLCGCRLDEFVRWHHAPDLNAQVVNCAS